MKKYVSRNVIFILSILTEKVSSLPEILDQNSEFKNAVAVEFPPLSFNDVLRNFNTEIHRKSMFVSDFRG